MKKILSIIVLAIFILTVLFTIPSNIAEKNGIADSNQEYASLPGVKIPPVPPKKWKK